MRVTSLFLAFISVGVAAAGLIPKNAVPYDTGNGGASRHSAAPVSSLIAPFHSKPIGKYSRFAASRSSESGLIAKRTKTHSHAATSPGANPTDVSTSLGFPPGGSDHPKPSGKPSPTAVHGHHSGSPSDGSDLKHSGKSSGPGSSLKFKPTAVYSVSPNSCTPSPTEIGSHGNHAPSDYSDQPKPSGKEHGGM
ncbi:hypothetical protein OG21DRAFT_1521116 [Imleria badia]|nr:hypothetical protein OG21DRAFT_1521116 [Imleria badia]